jgi:metal-responsive CopG/Arc/MetJ family transcriptional regulator
MKTVISLPDGVFRDAERLARRLKKSRSELYREAVAEYVVPGCRRTPSPTSHRS